MLKKIVCLIFAVVCVAALGGCNTGRYDERPPGVVPYDYDNTSRINNQSNSIIGYNDWASPGAFYDTGAEAADAR